MDSTEKETSSADSYENMKKFKRENDLKSEQTSQVADVGDSLEMPQISSGEAISDEDLNSSESKLLDRNISKNQSENFTASDKKMDLKESRRDIVEEKSVFDEKSNSEGRISPEGRRISPDGRITPEETTAFDERSNYEERPFEMIPQQAYQRAMPPQHYQQGRPMGPMGHHIPPQHGGKPYMSYPGMHMNQIRGNQMQPPGMRMHMPQYSRIPQEFKPEQQRIIENKPSPDDADLTDAMVFLNRIKEEYASEAHIYDKFLEAMRDFKFGKIDAGEVCSIIRNLFKDKPHLISSFDEYLPHHLKFINDQKAAQPFLNQRVPGRYQQIDRHSQQELRVAPPMDNRPIPQDMRTAPMDQRMNHSPPEKRVPDPRTPPSVFDDRMGYHYSRPAPAYPQAPHNPHPAYPPAYPYGRNPQRTQQYPLDGRYRHGSIPTAPIALKKETEKGLKKDKQKLFLDNLKKKYALGDRVYVAAIDALSNSNLGVDELTKTMKTIFAEDKEMFRFFLRVCDPDVKDLKPEIQKENPILDKIKNIMSSKGLLDDFSKMINFYNQNYISGEKLFFLLGKIIGNDEYLEELKKYLQYSDDSKVDENPKFELSERVGSYVRLKEKISSSECPAISRSVLNDRYVSVSTHTSEDDVYVFRQKNSSEEHMIRIGDDRSEFSVQIARLQFLICKLNKLILLMPPEIQDLDIKDVEMSTGVLKETLRFIYGEEGFTILDKLLTAPKIAVPKVLQRCYKVYKEFSLKQKENRFNWRLATESNFYKAYDIDGIEFKNTERNNLHSRSISALTATPIIKKAGPERIIDLVNDLFIAYVQNNYNSNKKQTPEDKIDLFSQVMKVFKSPSYSFQTDVDFYMLYFLIATLVERFEEMESLKIEIPEPSKIALSLKLVEESNFKTVWEAVVSLSKDLMLKTLDSEAYEEKIRIFTHTKGYKLYNLKKIMGKIAKLVGVILEKGETNKVCSFLISKKEAELMLKSVDETQTTVQDHQLVHHLEEVE